MDLVYAGTTHVTARTLLVSQSSKNIAMRPVSVSTFGRSAKRVAIGVQSRPSILPKALPLVHEENQAEGQQPPLPPSKYSEIISKLPTRNDWKFMPLHEYQGFWYFTIYLDALLAAQEKFEAQPNDIFLCSHPKTGTTWLKALTFAITTRSRYSTSESPLQTSGPHDLVPTIEIDSLTKETLSRHPDHPLLSTHIPYNSLPSSVAELGCKIVYICRDPKDVVVSMWHFLKKRLPEELQKDAYLSIEESFDLFCEGINLNGPYWDHILGYWKASQENPGNILFLRYEDMKKDTASNVKKLAEFIGYPFTPEEEKQGIVQQIVDLCSFESLKNLKATKDGAFLPESVYKIENTMFFRKAKSGDWRNYFTEEMGARLDQIVEDKLSGSGFSFLSHKSTN